MSKYFVSVEIAATVPLSEVQQALQEAFDTGTSGFFQVLHTRAPSFLVLFERDAYDDANYVFARLNKEKSNLDEAVQAQLAAELADGVGKCAQPVVDALQRNEGKCFDFQSGAITEMAREELAVA